jgi:NhaA family Na+:H+ antiporter
MQSTKLPRPVQAIAEFLRLEASAGIILVSCAVLALIVANSPLNGYYQHWFHTPHAFNFYGWQVALPGVFWINDILMAVFFLLVGLEIKREICLGELSSARKVSLPIIAALGGMVAPALIYFGFNAHDKLALQGWAIPTATDIAFALGIVSLLGRRVPVTLKLFLMALAIFDDLGAIIIIAIFYQNHFSWLGFTALLVCIGLLWLLNRYRVNVFWPYLIVGALLWASCLASGIHPTIAGVLLALAIPLRVQPDQPRDQSLLRRMERALHPWVAYAIVPIFSFANAGVSFSNLPAGLLLSDIPLGVLLGLFIGKQVGVLAASWLAIRCGLASMPRGANWLGLYGVAIICGVGFTMSLFIGTLAFQNLADVHQYLPALVRFGVFAGSILSGVLGYLLLSYAYPRVKESVIP